MVTGQKRTQVPTRNDGILPAFACLKMVILETLSSLASSTAVKARPVLAIWSANAKDEFIRSTGSDDLPVSCVHSAQNLRFQVLVQKFGPALLASE